VTDSYSSLLQRARTFTRYAFVPEPNWDILHIFADADFTALKHDLARMKKADLLRHMGDASDAAFGETFADLEEDIAIPLSGGRDSRFILCMALEYGLKDRILAVTWGVPGALDWELSCKVAAEFGVRHERIDTSARPITYADLKRAFHHGGRWSDLVSAHFNQRWRVVAPAGSCGIIGYLGGAPIGCHYKPGYEHLGFAAAVASFEKLHCRRDYGVSAIRDVADRLLPPECMSLPEQLDLVFWQEGYLRRVVAPATFNTRTPFAHSAWMKAMYALPSSYRAGSALFSEFLMGRFPRAFEIGTSGAYGARADAQHWQRRTRRQLLRLRYSLINASRTGEFLTLDKYGDERDLLVAMRRAADTEILPPPRQFDRILRREFRNARDAADARLHAVLLCNLICQVEGPEQATQTNAA
jgi:hypothetical protein